MNNYRLEIYDTAGTKKYLTDDFAKLGFVRRVNSPGLVQVQLSGANPILSNILDKWHIEVWRQPEGYAWAREIVGIYRKGDWEQPIIPSANLMAKGLLSKLGWRIVDYYAGTANHSKFIGVEAETISKTIVGDNCTVAGMTRLRAGTISGLSVQLDGGLGNPVDWYCAYDNVLASLQSLALIGGGDFDLVKLTSTTWEFRWYLGQLGTDRSASVFFSMGLGNMSNPKFGYDGIDAASVAIVGGKGEGSDRAVAVSTSADYNVTSNNIEVFVNATDVDTTDGLTDRGDKVLTEKKIKSYFTFEIQQTPTCQYGVHYFLGDLVSAINPFTLVMATYKVMQATVVVDKSGNQPEKVDIELVKV